VLPIEIKGEWHPKLCSAIQEQLVAHYTTPPQTNGYGVYLVLWTGGSQQPVAKDGGTKAKTPNELASRLHDFAGPQARKLIAVSTLNIGWPS
jgi:hypothetical protein